MLRLFDWRPDKLRGEREKNENVIVLKRLFKPELFDANPSLLIEYQKDLREECSKFGRVKRVVIYDVSVSVPGDYTLSQLLTKFDTFLPPRRETKKE